MHISRILVVCTGNICRSPIGEGLLAMHLAESRPNIELASAGTHALEGQPPDTKAEATASALGVDISGHRARQCDADNLLGSDLILTMSTQQKQWIETNFPVVRGRVFLFSQQTQQNDITDPYGGSQSLFDQIGQELDTNTRAWVKVLA